MLEQSCAAFVLPFLLGIFLQMNESALTGSRTDPGDMRVFAAVFSVRGSVSGSSAGRFGVFVRQSGDTTWSLVTRSNVFTFGLGRFAHRGSSRLYIAAGNGLHRSTDDGRTWRILTSWQTMEILSVVADPVDSATVYAATPWGVYKTINDGAAWVHKAKGFKRWFVQRLVMDPADRKILFAAAEDDLYRSTDAGDSWEPLKVGASQIMTVLQSRRNPAFLAVGIEDGGIRWSVDGGRHWKAADGIGNTTIYDISESPDGERLYAGGWQTGLWESNDRGKSWRRIWSDPNVEGIFTVRADPRNGDHLLIGTDGQGVFESNDRGRSWRSKGLTGAKVKQIEFYP
jgi:photosystem II stability/assembly factor-like uncharacterized protein